VSGGLAPPPDENPFGFAKPKVSGSNLSVSTLNVAFNEGAGDGNGRIILEQTRTRFDFFGNLWARSNAKWPLRYATSRGSVSPVEPIWTEEINEAVKFSNSGRASLKYPGVSDVTIDTSRSVLMTKIKRYGRTQIVRTYPDVLYDEDLGAIRVGRNEGSLAGGGYRFVEVPVWGAVVVTYQAHFRPLRYTPSVKRFPRGGAELTIGSIFAYHDEDVAVLDMKVESDDTKDWEEYCRLYSKIVLDPKGVWEFPPNWEQTYQSNRDQQGEQRADMPGEGVWPGHNIAKVDPDNHFVDERVHVIIEVNSFGQLKTTAFRHSFEQPKVGFFNYDPTYHLKFADPPGGAKATSAEEFKYDLRYRTWRDVFLDVNKDKIIDALSKQYKDLIVEGQRQPSPPPSGD
jgi:hypothetical protein